MPEEFSKPQVPLPLQRRHTDEYEAVQLTSEQRSARSEVEERGADDAGRVGIGLREYWASRRGTAAALLALNSMAGHRFYEVPEEARFDRDAADGSLGGDELVIDVHTHMTNDGQAMRPSEVLVGFRSRFQFFVDSGQFDFFKAGGSSWWPLMEELGSYTFAEYLRCMFVETETAVAVLTAPPPDVEGVDIISNDEMYGTHLLTERFGGSGRVLNHAVVHPTVPGAIQSMERWATELKPAGWKVYTLGLRGVGDEVWNHASGYMLDDEQYGLPFLEEARRLGVRNICTHKGISHFAPGGSPREIGTVARLYPDLRFLVYHSAYEVELEEGPYTEETADIGVNRLVRSLEAAGVGPSSNVYADLGTAWYGVLRQPVEAAHVLGKLLLAVGEDNVLWGTDGVWYGPPQSLVDSFRAFQIPEWMQEQFGYPAVTPEMRAKILSLNAARLYNIDLSSLRDRVARDDLAWLREAAREYRRAGLPGSQKRPGGAAGSESSLADVADSRWSRDAVQQILHEPEGKK